MLLNICIILKLLIELQGGLVLALSVVPLAMFLSLATIVQKLYNNC